MSDKLEAYLLIKLEDLEHLKNYYDNKSVNPKDVLIQVQDKSQPLMLTDSEIEKLK